MIKKIFIALLCVLPIFSVAQSSSQLKFGHVDLQLVLPQLPEYSKAEAELKKLGAGLENELVNFNKEFQTKYTNYQQEADSLSEEIRVMREAELMELQKKITEQREYSQQVYAKRQQEVYEPILLKIKKAIQEVGDENGFFYIFDLSAEPGLIYKSAKSIDITDLLLKKLLPAAGTAVAKPAPKPASQFVLPPGK